MYCKTTYGNKNSGIKQERFTYSTSFFHEEKENLCTTFHTRMQTSHTPNCSGCPTCGKTPFFQSKTNFSLSGGRYDQPLRENYCNDCSGRSRNRNVGKTFVNKDEFCDVDTQNYEPVLNRRTSRSTDSARGSMYSCDQIHVKDVPIIKDVNKIKGVSADQRKANASGLNCRTIDAEKMSGMANEQQHCGGSYHNIDGISCSEKSRTSCVFSRNTCASGDIHKENDGHDNDYVRFSETNQDRFDAKTTRSSNGKHTRKCTNNKMKADIGKGKSVYPEKNSSERTEEIKASFRGDGDNSTFRKTKNINPQKDNLRTSHQEEIFQKESRESKHWTEDKTEKDDTKGTHQDETSLKKDTDKMNPAENVKTEGQPSKPADHGTRDRSKLPRGSKRVQKRRTQRKPQSHVHHARDSEKQASGGVNEWLLFVYDSIKKGVVSTLSDIPSYLSIAWSIVVYFLLVLILLALPVLSCTWALLKGCAVYICFVPSNLIRWVRSFKDKIFQKPDENTHTTSREPSRRPASRQQSSPLPEADELVSKLLASKNLNPYEILGVSPSSTDEEIKKNYRDMAKLVHPDKNSHEDASEAFQILQAAFESICDEEKRMAYEFQSHRKRFEEEMEEFFGNVMEKVQEMKNRIMCRVCQKSHPRTLTDRLIFAARYCSDCGVRHAAREGDVWVETSHMGFKYYCYLCMDGQVYEVTEWGACQGLLRLKANSHYVFISCKSNSRSPWDEMFGESDRSTSNNKKKRKTKGKCNKNKKRF